MGDLTLPRFGDSPLLAIIRAEYLSWHHRKLATAVADEWPLPGDSKTIRSCHNEGLLPGLQGAHARFIFGQLQAQTIAIDPLLPHASGISDKDTTKEFVAAGMIDSKAEEISASLTGSMCEASSKCAEIRSSLERDALNAAASHLSAHGTVRVLWPPWRTRSAGNEQPQVLLVYQPDSTAIKRWLQAIRDDAPIPGGRDASKLYGELCIPLYAATKKPDVIARLTSAGICAGPFTAVLELNESHYCKLCALLQLTSARSELGSSEAGDSSDVSASLKPILTPSEELATQLFCVVARYETFSGNSGGIQGAVPHYVFDVLEESLGVSHECFASPLNCHFPSYCSAFPDTDATFGSKGSFFEFTPLSGSFQANPPFVNATMLATAKHVEALLVRAAAAGTALLFFLIVPAWTDAYFHQLLKGSAFTRAAQTAARKEHEYVDGLQHRVGRSTWGANVDSTWFVLATDAAVRKYDVGPATVEKLTAAFARTVDSDAPGRVFKHLLPPLRPSSGSTVVRASAGSASAPSSRGGYLSASAREPASPPFERGTARGGVSSESQSWPAAGPKPGFGSGAESASWRSGATNITASPSASTSAATATARSSDAAGSWR